MGWANWYWDVCDKSEDDARAYIAGLDDDTVIAFWEWNDAEARMAISRARDGVGDYTLDAVAESLRDSLVDDVVAEIRFRAGVANADA